MAFNFEYSVNMKFPQITNCKTNRRKFVKIWIIVISHVTNVVIHLAADFLSAFWACSWILRGYSWSEVQKKGRCGSCLLRVNICKRFVACLLAGYQRLSPYCLTYFLQAASVIVLAVAHTEYKCVYILKTVAVEFVQMSKMLTVISNGGWLHAVKLKLDTWINE